MIVCRSRFEEATGLRSLLAVEFNKDSLSEPQFPTSSISALNAVKPGSILIDVVFWINHSSNLKEIKGNMSIEKCFLSYS